MFWPATNLTQKLRGVPLDQAIQVTEGRDEYLRLDLKQLRWEAEGAR